MPAVLDQYMAPSAKRISSARPMACRGNSAIPTLRVTASTSAAAARVSTAARSLSTTSWAAWVSQPLSASMNSSPPTRPHRSPGLRSVESPCATAVNTASPYS